MPPPAPAPLSPAERAAKRQRNVAKIDFQRGDALGIFAPVQTTAVTNWKAVIDDMFAEKSIEHDVTSPLERLDITKSVRPEAEKTPEEVIKEHSDFVQLLASLNVTDELGRYVLDVVTPRLARLPHVSAEAKRELLTRLAERLNAPGPSA